jgi:lysophospholipase
MRWSVLVALILSSPLLLHAIGEASFERDWKEKVAPYLAERAVFGDLVGEKGVRLRWLAIEDPAPRAAIVLVGGHAESFYKYAELCYDLRDLGLSIYALDPRGQGASQHLLPDREKSHVESWQSYLADLTLFVDAVVKTRTRARLIGIGHSLGGGILAAYLERFPDDFDSAILSGPLVGHRMPGAAIALLGLLDAFGGRAYLPGGGPFTVAPFETNKETHSRARHERKFQDYTDHPEIRMGQPTIHWVNETRRMARWIQTNAKKIATALLVFQAAEDAYIDARAIETFCAKVKSCRRIVREGARHEVFIETDAIRDRVLAETRAFIVQRVAADGEGSR